MLVKVRRMSEKVSDVVSILSCPTSFVFPSQCSLELGMQLLVLSSLMNWTPLLPIEEEVVIRVESWTELSHRFSLN